MMNREISFSDAIREGLRSEMKRDKRVFILGEDVGAQGGAFGVTKGLWEEFGDNRVKDTPISEAAIIGASIGAACTGMRPVPEIMYADFLPITMEQIVNQMAKIRYMFGGKANMPVVVRTAFGAGMSAAAQHSQSLESLFCHIPGLKVVVPSTPYDAKGLLISSIRDDNPVIFFEHKLLYASKGLIPERDYQIPLGKADIKKEGKDVTIITWGRMVHMSMSVAQKLAERGIDVEVIDLRTLFPLDKECFLESVKKTGRVVVVHEAWMRGGFGGEIVSIIAKEAFDHLDAPIERVAALNVPIPFSPVLEKFVLPSEENIENVVLKLLGE
ncbi:2-oxoisovalerate dehydrogenase subunit beta [subsurface metagenome]|jgi:pyruvate dehydrogenase E1 component beta subunit